MDVCKFGLDNKILVCDFENISNLFPRAVELKIYKKANKLQAD